MAGLLGGPPSGSAKPMGGLGKMQHSPIKPQIHAVHHANPVVVTHDPSGGESIAGLMAMANNQTQA